MVEPPIEDGHHWQRIARALAFLTAHWREQPSLDKAAAVAGLSAHHFQRVFTRHVGVSPKKFVAHLTLDAAKSDLRRGGSVLNASLDAGLSGPSRLHDLCLKIEAMTPGDYARQGEGIVIAYGYHPSPFGSALVTVTALGLCGLAFGESHEKSAMLEDMRGRWPRATFVLDQKTTEKYATAIFGDARQARTISLHLLGTPWQIKVWQALLAIPPGRTSTYHDVALSLGSPRHARAVGTATGRNPISWLIPCHRVLGSSGALTGYRWGVERKHTMLALEAAIRAEGAVERAA